MEEEKEFYVYVFINPEWTSLPFYVGKGSGNRINDLSKRPIQIKAILKNYDCIRKKVAYFDNEQDAYKFEFLLKEKLKEIGSPLVDAETAKKTENMRRGIERAKAEGRMGRRKGYTYETNKSKAAKRIILENSKDFYGDLKDIDIIKMINVRSRNTYYKYKRQLRDELNNSEEISEELNNE